MLLQSFVYIGTENLINLCPLLQYHSDFIRMALDGPCGLLYNSVLIKLPKWTCSYLSSDGDAGTLFYGFPTLRTESGCFSRDIVDAKISHLKE